MSKIREDLEEVTDEEQEAMGQQTPKSKSAKQESYFFRPQVVAVLACISWMAVSSGLILVNKYLMSTDGFHYPMALSGLGMCFSSVASWTVCRVLKLVEIKRQITWRFWATRILPVGFFMALTLHFGNVVYLYLTVSFIQMLKAFTPIVTMIALFVAQLETPNRKLIFSVLAIAVGTAIASYGEINLSIVGVIFMFLSESFESIRLVMTQTLLVGLRFHPIEGLMHLAPACSLWLGLGVIFMEWGRMMEENAFQLVMNKPWMYALAAAMGFMVNLLAYMVIQTSSSLTLKVLGTVKNALVVWIGVVFLGDIITGLQGFGYAISLGAFGWYNYLKMNPQEGAYTLLPTKDSNIQSASANGSHADPEKELSFKAWQPNLNSK